MDEKLLKQGMFSWFELVTSDVAAAKKFYGELLGWTTADMPMGGTTYTVVSAGGEQIAGMMPPPEASGMPPTWGVYVSVDDVDATAKRAGQLGGEVLVGPRDIPAVGRFAVIRDPQGAVITFITYLKQ